MNYKGEMNKHSYAGRGEAMALKWRCKNVYKYLKPYTRHSELKVLAALLDVHPVTLSRWRNQRRAIGKRVWSTLRMAEIAAKHEPEAVVEYCALKAML